MAFSFDSFREHGLELVDTGARVTVDPDASHSLSRNTPFAGHTLTGRVRTTILRGRVTATDGEVIN